MEGSGHPTVLVECRDLVTARLRGTVSRVVDDTAQALERQTVGGSRAMPGGEVFDAVRELRQRRSEFGVRFEHRYREIFDQCVAGATPPAVSGTPVSSACRSLLMEIDRRLSGIVQPTAAGSAGAVMEPEALLAAFDRACADMLAGDGVRRALRELFLRHVQQELPRVYGEVNAMLVRRGLPLRSPGERLQQGAREPFSTFPGRRPTVYSQERSRRQAPVSEHTMTFVRSIINGHELPYFIRAFSTELWARVLDRSRGERGEDSDEWIRSVRTLEDLVHTMEAFNDPERRQLTVWALPGLVERIRAGMDQAAISHQEQVLFLKTLRAHQLRQLERDFSARRPSDQAGTAGD